MSFYINKKTTSIFLLLITCLINLHAQSKFRPRLELGVGPSGVRNNPTLFRFAGSIESVNIIEFTPKSTIELSISHILTKSKHHPLTLGLATQYGENVMHYTRLLVISQIQQAQAKFLYLGPSLNYSPSLFKSNWKATVGLSWGLKMFDNIQFDEEDSHTSNFIENGGLNYALSDAAAIWGFGYEYKKTTLWLKVNHSINNNLIPLFL